MNYLVDTNVISELFKPRPQASVVRWFDETKQEDLHLSVLTMGELRKGVELVGPGIRRSRLIRFLERDIPAMFAERLIPIDLAVADAWGILEAQAGRPLSTIDALLAATALSRQMTFVTRNTRDFEFAQLKLFNPWES